MSPLVLLPCSSGKTLAVAEPLRGRALRDVDAGERAATWRERVSAAHPRKPVRELYKGGAWTIARDAADAAVRREGAARVVSAGLGLPMLEDEAPGYDITFTAGSPDLIPGGAAPEARASWWQALAGEDALLRALEARSHAVLLVALPEAYLEAVAPSLSSAIERLGPDRVSVLASQLSPFARRHLASSWVRVTADRTTTLRGNAGQTVLSALLYILETLPADEALTRPAVQRLLERLERRDTPLYPRRQRLGREHTAHWIRAAIASGNPPRSASEALRRYRDEGFAYEQ